MQSLEQKISASKKAYASALKKLEVLNTEIHRRRQSSVSQQRFHWRKSCSTGNSPEPMRTTLNAGARRMGGSGSFVASACGGGASDTESINSLHLGDLKDQFSGSTGSLPSVGTSSVSELSPSPTPEPSIDEENPVSVNQVAGVHEESEREPPAVVINRVSTSNPEGSGAAEEVNSEHVSNGESDDTLLTSETSEPHSDPLEVLANKLVQQTLSTVAAKQEEEQRTSNPVSYVTES